MENHQRQFRRVRLELPTTAARVSLDERRDEGTGFSMAWKAACWARLRDGDRALRCLSNLVAMQTCPNLFSKCFCAPQVDGALGAAAIAEMLVQSHAGGIDLLPALPAAWRAGGRLAGLRARGGFVVDVEWEDGRVVKYRIAGGYGRPVVTRINGERIRVAPEPS